MLEGVDWVPTLFKIFINNLEEKMKFIEGFKMGAVVNPYMDRYLKHKEVEKIKTLHEQELLIVLPKNLGVLIMDKDPTVLIAIHTQNKKSLSPKSLQSMNKRGDNRWI